MLPTTISLFTRSSPMRWSLRATPFSKVFARQRLIARGSPQFSCFFPADPRHRFRPLVPDWDFLVDRLHSSQYTILIFKLLSRPETYRTPCPFPVQPPSTELGFCSCVISQPWQPCSINVSLPCGDELLAHELLPLSVRKVAASFHSSHVISHQEHHPSLFTSGPRSTCCL